MSTVIGSYGVDISRLGCVELTGIASKGAVTQSSQGLINCYQSIFLERSTINVMRGNAWADGMRSPDFSVCVWVGRLSSVH